MSPAEAVVLGWVLFALLTLLLIRSSTRRSRRRADQGVDVGESP